jgi:DNA-binding transcriptional regulator YiaG
MQPSEDQLTALGNYRDIILQHIPQIAEAIGVSVETLTGWLEGKGEPTSEEAGKILDFLKEKGSGG